MNKTPLRLALLVLASLIALPACAEPSTQPAPIDPKAAELLKQTSQAYLQLKSLSVSGTLSLSAEIQGQQMSQHSDFTGSFHAPLLFHHEITDDTVIAGTGSKVFVYLPRFNRYLAADAPPAAGSRVNSDDLPDDVRGLLHEQDLSLMLAISDNPSDELTNNATSVTAAPDQTIDGKTYPALAIALPAADLIVAFDPDTHLVRRFIADKSRAIRQRGAEVKIANITVDYLHTTPNATVTADQFAFSPPATAQELKPEGAAAMALVGHPAPPFNLDQLTGGKINNADLKGSVYVVDFWATWCGPCRISLPGLDETYQHRKADGVKIFAINKQEDADTIRTFITTTKLSIPVLLDLDGKIGDAYGADAIPQTVVVGRDGKVKNVYIGTGPGREQEIDAAIAAALKS